MRSSHRWRAALLAATLGCAACAAPHSWHEPTLVRAQLVHPLGGDPAQSAAVGADRRLLEWRFTQAWPELEATQVRMLALEDSRGQILWWLRDPPGWPSLPGHGGYV